VELVEPQSPHLPARAAIAFQVRTPTRSRGRGQYPRRGSCGCGTKSCGVRLAAELDTTQRRLRLRPVPHQGQTQTGAQGREFLLRRATPGPGHVRPRPAARAGGKRPTPAHAGLLARRTHGLADRTGSGCQRLVTIQFAVLVERNSTVCRARSRPRSLAARRWRTPCTPDTVDQGLSIAARCLCLVLEQTPYRSSGWRSSFLWVSVSG